MTSYINIIKLREMNTIAKAIQVIDDTELCARLPLGVTTEIITLTGFEPLEGTSAVIRQGEIFYRRPFKDSQGNIVPLLFERQNNNTSVFEYKP